MGESLRSLGRAVDVGARNTERLEYCWCKDRMEMG